ncbi:5'-deoxynucleotidase [Methylomarinum sp. Ch1-1]|uniref:5'-deoxynucleotidase n=1 Tax=Methylomarinum roseum TaxID=3067653 RepID=A0AAU7NX38_9GAMM|nr:5'-deoxynucleotidase [Methylomarinum sp. Ch1-1]MDP4522392.1 5'-deoxynucleotidase [Methylomarinum sp. Ch1-1]
MSGFFATINRLKYIQRWGLKRNSVDENVKEHSFDVCVIAHLLCAIKNEYYGGAIDPGEVVLAALYHDAHESITGDLPTPIKRFNREIFAGYKDIEAVAAQALIDTLPDQLKDDLFNYVTESCDLEVMELVKAADTISAYVKCVEEIQAGNQEFKDAMDEIEKRLNAIDLAEVDYFRKYFLPEVHLTVDQLYEAGQ